MVPYRVWIDAVRTPAGTPDTFPLTARNSLTPFLSCSFVLVCRRRKVNVFLFSNLCTLHAKAPGVAHDQILAVPLPPFRVRLSSVESMLTESRSCIPFGIITYE